MNIIGGGGFNGRKASDFTFKPEDSKTFKQKESQNLGIICSAMCNDLKTVCKFKEKDEVVQNCNKIRDTIGTTRDKSKMDLWNSLFKVGGGVKNTTEAISTGKNITEASGTGKNITEASGTAKNITEASGTAKNITDNKETKEKKKP
ncbi:hypothetical protein BY996DRAFT_6415846 [Phakopsora pachyrhizi]|nr:hypothetical protein BY996DRAFT_6415846 [Phakopsora pachyrhizi]